MANSKIIFFKGVSQKGKEKNNVLGMFKSFEAKYQKPGDFTPAVQYSYTVEK